jgi:site-specific DNA recombinase
LAKIKRTLKQMLSVIEEGGHTRGMTDRMRELEAREDVLGELLAQEPADIPDIHPNVSGIYRKKVERLTEALNTPEDRNEAAEAIRALVEKITLRPGPNRGEIDATLHGELGTILGWIEAQAVEKTRKRETPAAFATGVSVSVVAGIGFEPMTFRL